MAYVHYLTVQDILWIHLQVTGSVSPFDYAKLEDGAYFQYNYGRHADELSQAGRFLPGLARKQAFPHGNEAVAFVACLAFLKLNGIELDLKDANGTQFMHEALVHESALEPLRRWVKDIREPHGETVQDTVLEILAEFPKTIAALAKAPAA